MQKLKGRYVIYDSRIWRLDKLIRIGRQKFAQISEHIPESKDRYVRIIPLEGSANIVPLTKNTHALHKKIEKLKISTMFLEMTLESYSYDFED